MGTPLERVRGRKNGDQNQRSSECPFILFQKGVPVGVVSGTHRRHAVDTRMGHDEQTTLHCIW